MVGYDGYDMKDDGCGLQDGQDGQDGGDDGKYKGVPRESIGFDE